MLPIGSLGSVMLLRTPPFEMDGSGGRIRTYDMAVNSRPLYH